MAQGPRKRWNFALRMAASSGPATLLVVLFFAPAVSAAATRQSSDKSSNADKSDKNNDPTATTRLKVVITDPHDKPVAQASVYVRFPQSGGVFHKDKLAEMDLKTNDDGSVKVPEIPQGKIMIQVIAKGWRTYGRWYDVEKAEDTIQIKLQQPPHWY